MFAKSVNPSTVYPLLKFYYTFCSTPFRAADVHTPAFPSSSSTTPLAYSHLLHPRSYFFSPSYFAFESDTVFVTSNFFLTLFEEGKEREREREKERLRVCVWKRKRERTGEWVSQERESLFESFCARLSDSFFFPSFILSYCLLVVIYLYPPDPASIAEFSTISLFLNLPQSFLPTSPSHTHPPFLYVFPTTHCSTKPLSTVRSSSIKPPPFARLINFVPSVVSSSPPSCHASFRPSGFGILCSFHNVRPSCSHPPGSRNASFSVSTYLAFLPPSNFHLPSFFLFFTSFPLTSSHVNPWS